MWPREVWPRATAPGPPCRGPPPRCWWRTSPGAGARSHGGGGDEVLNTGAGVAALHLAAGRHPALLGAAVEVGAEDADVGQDVCQGVVARPRLAAQLPVLHPAHPAGHTALGRLTRSSHQP